MKENAKKKKRGAPTEDAVQAATPRHTLQIKITVEELRAVKGAIGDLIESGRLEPRASQQAGAHYLLMLGVRAAQQK